VRFLDASEMLRKPLILALMCWSIAIVAASAVAGPPAGACTQTGVSGRFAAGGDLKSVPDEIPVIVSTVRGRPVRAERWDLRVTERSRFFVLVQTGHRSDVRWHRHDSFSAIVCLRGPRLADVIRLSFG
jgi:hypothetical protein